MTPFLLDIHWSVTLLVVLLVMVCVLLTLIILVQKPKGGGLAGAFGGATSSGSVLGAKTGDFLTWTTVGFFVMFVVLSILLIKLGKPATVEQLQDEYLKEQAAKIKMQADLDAQVKGAATQPGAIGIPGMAPGMAPAPTATVPAAPKAEVPAAAPTTAPAAKSPAK
jgi:preprotein translocase subunit SecG